MVEFDTHSLFIALGIAVAALTMHFFKSKFTSSPALRLPSVKEWASAQLGWRERIASLPSILRWTAFALFLLAYADPHSFRDVAPDHEDRPPVARRPSEGIAIYLVLDDSGSMYRDISVLTPDGRREKMSKIEMLKIVTEQFVRGDKQLRLPGRSNDLIGMIAFARSAQVVSPLTLDHALIEKKLRALTVNRDPTQVGTGIGYAIFKAVNLIAETRHFGQERLKEGKPAYQMKSAIILLVTDGFQETNPEDVENPLRTIAMDQAAKFAKDNDVKVYIVNIDPDIADDKYKNYRTLFDAVTTMTGGKFFMVDSSTNLVNIYHEIDKLEKSSLPTLGGADKELYPELFRRHSWYPILIALGLLSLMGSIIFDTVILRRVP